MTATYRTGPEFDLDFDSWAMDLAAAVATGADCSRRMVGAVLCKGQKILAVGFNSAPEGVLGCLAGSCPRATSGVAPGSSYTGKGACISIHAEQKVLLQAKADAEGATLYVTEQPCDGCFRMIKCSGIARWRSPGFEWRRS